MGKGREYGLKHTHITFFFGTTWKSADDRPGCYIPHNGGVLQAPSKLPLIQCQLAKASKFLRRVIVELRFQLCPELEPDFFLGFFLTESENGWIFI